MNFRTGNPTQREHTLQASVLGLEAASEGPFVQGRPSTYLFNYRYSTLALLMPLLPTDSNVIRYQDLSFKLNFPTRRLGRFEVWGIGGLDAILGGGIPRGNIILIEGAIAAAADRDQAVEPLLLAARARDPSPVRGRAPRGRRPPGLRRGLRRLRR